MAKKKSASKEIAEDGQEEQNRMMRVDDRVEGFDEKRFMQFCRALKIAVLSRAYDQAHRELDLFIRDIGKRDAVTLDSPICVLEGHVELSFITVLEDNGYEKLRSLDQASDRELTSYAGVAGVRLAQLRDALDKLLRPRRVKNLASRYCHDTGISNAEG